MPLVQPQIRATTLLSPISWQTYEHLLNDLGEGYAVRLTYDQGCLEIMPPPLPPHEIYSTLIHDFIRILGEELDIDIHSIGSTTLRRQDLQQGLEPDKAYYIQNEAQVRDKRELELTQLPPPDLVVEIDTSNSSLNKLPIYLALGVPEVWRYDGEVFYMYQKFEDEYQICERSFAFGLSLNVIIPQLLNNSFTIGEKLTLREFRQWVKTAIEY